VRHQARGEDVTSLACVALELYGAVAVAFGLSIATAPSMKRAWAMEPEPGSVALVCVFIAAIALCWPVIALARLLRSRDRR
jgi:hypothetical protein